jgi:hypothetical protein
MSKELTVPANEETVAALAIGFPVEEGFTRIRLPRMDYQSQDLTEGKGKTMKVVVEAGTFSTEHPTDEENPETGKKIWDTKEIGTEIEATIVFQRKQLSYYDEPTETYTSSPIYDNDDEIIPLWRNKAEIDRGTPAELKSREEYKTTTQKGKPSSKLKDNRILYILHEGELYELSIHGTSMYAYKDYAKKCRPAVPAVLTVFNSESKENGSIAWNQMTFVAKRLLSDKEAVIVLEKQTELKDAISQEKSFYAGQNMPMANAALADEFKK